MFGKQRKVATLHVVHVITVEASSLCIEKILLSKWSESRLIFCRVILEAEVGTGTMEQVTAST